MWSSKSSGATAGAASGVLVAVLFVIVAALIFGGIFLVVQGPEHFLALLAIGFLSLLFAVVAYLAQALTRSGAGPRAVAWGFGAFGFGVLFLTVGLLPFLVSGLITQLGQIELLILLVLLLVVPVVWFTWRARGNASDQQREVARHEWSQHPPPSAFSYAAARDPAASSAPPTDAPPRGGA